MQAIADACVQSQGRERAEAAELKTYVTHVVHLDGEGAPKVDREAFSKVGVEVIKTYGRKTSEGELIFDAGALSGALGMILGRGARGDRSRRNTLER